MKRKKFFKRFLLLLLLAFIVMQFFRPDRSNPKFEASNDLIAMTNPPKEIESLLRNACYDCHSNETRYPWYSNVAPVSWWLQNHIEEGREHLNFSNWGTFEVKKQNHKLHECEEEVEEGEMPLKSYTWTHGDAKLTSQQKKELAEWFEAQMTEEPAATDE